jgi:hypothetical protein
MRIAVSAVLTVAVAGWMFAQQKSVSGSENGCSNAVLHLRCLRQPPVFHRGEVIQAKLSLASNRQAGLTALPGTRRGFFREIFVWEPEKDAVDPFTLDPRIRVGDQLGSGWSEEKAREIEVNEWVQFRRPGRYVLHAILKRIVPEQPMGKDRKPKPWCELRSNNETVEILPPDARWEVAELARIDRLLESSATRFAAASALRYLNTPEAAVALARWYLRLTGEPENSELAKGIFESQHASGAQAELEKALRSAVPFTENALGTLALLEVRNQFVNRPRPSEPKAASAWSREYWALFDSVKAKYTSMATRRPH